ncbi:oligosaccharide flippase family protein [Nocardia yamanashiensis]|uniref:lipopolysaccharide biosynthesis protein n=1 Tax=Nocardia yamanashiensis TaxID=209247 RepID=UPI001E50B122|nr:oligosaccharide flippase family protein [Nocardia yamanashiensis]UGT45690.1 oligosaccharide flippase family protein [Nocardia yamanashiensis]
MGGVGGILRDIALVTFGKYGQYVITLVTVPLLARTLGPHGTGLLAIGMSSYFIGSLLVDLGITQFLAARVHESELGRAEINRLRGSYLAIRLGTLAVIGATLLGSLAAGAAPPLHMVLLGLFAGGFWSVSEDWLLIGQGRFGSSTGYQGVGRIVYLVLLIVLLPHYPTATTAVLCLLISSAPTVGLTWWDSVRNYGPPAKPYGVRAMVRMAAPVFTSRMLVTGYGQGSAAVYSAVLDAASLGLYSAGDRLVRAIQSSLDPIGFALLPRMARRSTHDRFWRNSIQALVAVVTVATVATVSVWVLAPTLIHLIYSHDFDGAIGLLRLEVLILPATTITSYVTTAILPVKSDTMGVLIGAIIGTCIAGIALAYAVRTQSVWTLVYGSVSAEIGVALWYIIRVRWLIVRERSVRSGASGSDPATVLMGKGDPA